MEIDPALEVEFRTKLARSYFEKAEKFFSTKDFKECAEASQFSAENAGKAVIALRRIPSWSHDPSNELTGILDELEEGSKEAGKGLSEIVHSLAPEHGLATYGKPTEGITPWDLYDETKARKCLEKAREALGLMDRIIRIEKSGSKGRIANTQGPTAGHCILEFYLNKIMPKIPRKAGANLVI